MSLLLLDTHVWVWNTEGSERRIGRRTRRLLSKAESVDGIRVSTVSVFELGALYTAGRLRLDHAPEPWVTRALEAPGVRLADVSVSVAVEAGRLPREALPDPLDRFIVATAQELSATLLTCDRRILDYAAATHNVRVHDGAS